MFVLFDGLMYLQDAVCLTRSVMHSQHYVTVTNMAA